METVEEDKLERYVRERGYKAKPLVVEGRLMGWTLSGPRQSTRFVTDMQGAKLFCDGVDYATRQVQARRSVSRR